MNPACFRRNALRLRSGVSAATAILLLTASGVSAVAGQKDEKDKDKKAKGPSLSLRVNPSVGFSPVHVVVTAELRGGADTDEDLYCPASEWDWGDGTLSEARQDCEPFTAGTSQVKRRWTEAHTFTTAGTYRVILRLKRGSKTVASGNTAMQVRPGVRDLSDTPQP